MNVTARAIARQQLKSKPFRLGFLFDWQLFRKRATIKSAHKKIPPTFTRERDHINPAVPTFALAVLSSALSA